MKDIENSGPLFRLPLRQQGIVLVASVLLIQLVFFVAQALLLEQVEKEAKEIERTRNLVNLCTRLSELVFAAARQGSQYTVSHDRRDLSAFQADVKLADSTFASLRDGLKSSPALLRQLDAVELEFQKTIKLCNSVVDLAQLHKPGQDLLSYKALFQIRAAARQLNEDLIAFTDELRKVAMSSPAGQRQMRSRLKQALFLSVILNVVLVSLAAWFYFRSVVARINRLVDNASRLAREEPLLPVIGGADELHFLDKVFHQTAKDVENEQSNLRSREQSLRDIVEALPLGLLLVRQTNKDQQITFANQNILTTIGYKSTELIGAPLTTLLSSPTLTESTPLPLPELLASGSSLERALYTKQGTTRYFEISASPYSVFSDQTIVSFLDITEKTELQQLKNALVSVVSHELRTPLTSVRGFLTLLQLNALGEVTSRTTEAASKAEANVVRLINLVNDILDVEKIEAGTIQLDFSAVAISSIVAQAAAALAEVAAEENLLLTVECLDAAVIADANRLLQAIIHLLSYAIGRSKNNDQIRIKSRLLLDGVCEISVEDQGAPIPDDQIFLLFERFAIREPAIAEGKGGDGTAAARGSILGLAICKAIVQRHGGTVGAKRGRLQGALLWFTIPARRSDGGQSFSKSGVANQ